MKVVETKLTEESSAWKIEQIEEDSDQQRALKRTQEMRGVER